MQRRTLLDRRLHIVMGKGGVGRSTVAATLALAAARRGRRALVCELRTDERISGLFGASPVGDSIGQVDESVWAVNISPASALREVALLKLRLESVYHLVFENRLVRDFLGGIPGLPDLLMLGKCTYHVGELDPGGDPRWDVVIVDAPATGHGVPFLRIPQVIVDLFGDSPITREAAQIGALLADPARTAVHLVTLPEELPTAELLGLEVQLRERLGLPLGCVFVNQVLLPLTGAGDLDSISDLLEGLPADAEPRLRALLELGRSWGRRVQRQLPYVRRVIDATGAPCVMLPRLFAPAFRREAISSLAEHLLRWMAEDE